MRTFITFLFLVCSSFVFGNSFFGPLPAWVKEIEVPNAENLSPSDEAEKRYLLYNRQVNSDSKEKFEQCVFQILNQNSAHNDSQIEIEFDPSYQTLSLHELCVYRNGQRIEKKDSSRIQILQRELDLEAHILNGKSSLVALVDDVRIGDILSYSYTVQGEQSVYKDHFFLTHFTAINYPIERNYLRVILPTEKPVFLKHHIGNVSSDPTIIPTADNEWIFDASNIESINYEANTPLWFSQIPFLSLSEFKDWKEVAALFTPYYEIPSSEIPELHKFAYELTKECSTAKEKALKLLQFVQEDIRYFGLEMNVRALYPTSPTKVLKQRYGDCKDKTLLLRGLLESIGICSTPILVSSCLKHNITERLPSPSHFDHVILSIQIGMQDYFVDPTLSMQGGTLNSIYLPPYLHGLSLSTPSKGLISLPLFQYPEPTIDVNTTYTEGSDNQLLIESVTIYRDIEADYFRGVAAKQGKKLIKESYASYYSESYGNVLDATLEIQDNLRTNKLRVIETYTIERSPEEEHLLVFPVALSVYLTQQVESRRNAPLLQSHPENIREKITFFSSTSDNPFARLNDNQVFNHPWGEFSCIAKADEQTFTLECSYRSKKDHILPEELADFRSYIKSLSNESSYELTTLTPKNSVLEKTRKYPSLGYSLILLALGAFVLAIKRHLKTNKAEKQLWKQKLSLLKKQ